MKVIKRSSDFGKKKFIVIKSHYYEGKNLKIGETIEREISDIETSAMVQRGYFIPDDLPAVGRYITLKELKLPGKKEAFTSKIHEVVELTDEQALKLMLSGHVIPIDDNQWRPRNRRLKKQHENKLRRY